MDDIGLYKGKLDEALNIVPSMSQEKKWEAVTYWNDVALQFQKIVATTSTEISPSNMSGAIIADPEMGSTMVEDKNVDMISDSSCVRRNQQTVSSLDTSHSSLTASLAPLGTSQIGTADAMVANAPIIIGPAVSSELPPDGTSISKNMAVTLQHGLEFDNIILSETLGCHRTMSDIAAEIGNGQFDRGPDGGIGDTVVDEPTNTFVETVSVSVPNATIISHEVHQGQIDQQQHEDHSLDIETVIHQNEACMAQATVIPTYHRQVDAYTHSDRPLQQIQPFDVPNNQTDIVYQSPSSNYNRMRAFIYNNNQNCLDHVIDDDDHHNHSHHHHHHDHDQDIRQQALLPQQLDYNASPIDACSTFSGNFSAPATPNPTENVSFEELEQIVDIKRELIDDSELVYNPVSNFSCNSNEASSNCSANMCVNQQPHTCDVCGKSGFSTKGNLKRHLKAHSGEKPYKCDYCDSCFTEKKSLKIHVRRHTGEKPYKCNHCDKLFSQTGVLQSHMALHLNERKYDCQKCGKAFRQRSQLKLHLMRHDGVKRLECQTCNAKFLTKGDLERHCRIHTGEKPYRCALCNKTFTRQQSLNEHMNRHTGKKPYDCKYCDKTFSEMSACYKHAKTHKRPESNHHQAGQQREQQQQQQQQQQAPQTQQQ